VCPLLLQLCSFFAFFFRPGVQLDSKTDRLLQFYDAEPEEFAYAWAFLFIGVGIMYLLRPKAAVTHRLRKKKRIE
jgi:hypothetical protein